MDHQAAVSGKLTERYLLNELAPEERDDFEEHFFECAECADDVRLGASLVANAKDVLRAESRAPERAAARKAPRWLGWLWSPAPAYGIALSLLMFSVQQHSVVQRVMEPQVITAAALRPATRGDAQVIRVNSSQQLFQLAADVPPGLAVVCEFRNAAAEVMFRKDAVADAAAGTLNFLLPVESFPDGSYKLLIHGKAPDGAGRTFEEQYEFVVRR